MVEGARLESVYTVTPYRGFESLPLRHLPVYWRLPKSLKPAEIRWLMGSRVYRRLLTAIPICDSMLAVIVAEYRIGYAEAREGIDAAPS